MATDILETASATAPAARDSSAGEREPDAVYLVTQAQIAELERIFGRQPVRVGQYERGEGLRAQARELAYRMLAWCPEGRERELAMQHLEQALMWAAAAMARCE